MCSHPEPVRSSWDRSCGVLAVALLLCLFSFFGTARDSQAKPLKVVVLTDAAGLGDRSFNDMCWQGVQKAKQDFGISPQFVQSREQADYVSNITMAAQNADIVVTLGYLYTDAVRKVAPYFPNARFIHIEGDINEPNVASFDFKSEEGGFLAGLVAGLFTRTGKVGVVSGMDIPPVEAYVSGFHAGVKTAEKTGKKPVECIAVSAGSFNDPVKGKALARTLIDKGADVIFRAAGNTGVGVLETIKGSKDAYMIADDLDVDAELPGRILTSTLKRMDVAVHGAIRDIVQGRFTPGHRWLGAADGAMDITDMKYTQQLFTGADLQAIAKARELLRKGKIDVPGRHTEVERFQPPDL